MSKIEKLLYKEKIDSIEAPDEMYSTLSNSLNMKTDMKSKPRISYKTAAVILIICILVGYNINTLAYYSKKLMGFDNVMNATLQNLNELGKGQNLMKTIMIDNDVEITLDGVMLDDNNFIVFYTINAPKGNVDQVYDKLNVSLSGFSGPIIQNHGTGESNESGTQMKWMVYYETPSIFVNKITFHVQYTGNSVTDTREISFRLDRNKAMGHILEKKINKQFQIYNGNITVKKLIASPTSTKLKGEIQNIFQLGMDQISGERLRPGELDMRLYADDKEVSPQGSSMSTDFRGITFSFNYDALPKNLKSLHIKLTHFISDQDVHEEIPLKIGADNQNISILDNIVNINDVYNSNGQTFVSVTSDESTLLSKVFLMMDDEKVPLEKTISEELIKEKDGNILKTRTLVFNGMGTENTLSIVSITFKRIYNEVMDIDLD
ncbi:MAG: DUF4179 domain-containing protein [Eubacteriales bacterium]